MAVTYTSSQNNRSSDKNRTSLTPVSTAMTNEITRATAAETSIRNNLSTLIGTVIDSALNPLSTNPVENKVITAEITKKASADTTLHTVARTGSYESLTNKPTIPTYPTVDSIISSESENPVGNKWIVAYVVEKVDDDSALKPVAKSGSYNDLSDLPESDINFNLIDSKVVTDGSFTLNVAKTYSTGGVLTGVTGTITSAGTLSSIPTATFTNALVATLHFLDVEAGGYSNVEYKFSELNPNQGKVEYRYWRDTATRPLNPGATLFNGWWTGTDIAPTVDKASDMFPTSNHALKCVCSHGTSQFIGSRTRTVIGMEDRKSVCETVISNINSTLDNIGSPTSPYEPITLEELDDKIEALESSKTLFDNKLIAAGINPPEKFADYPSHLVNFDSYDIDGSSDYLGIPSTNADGQPLTAIRKYVLCGITKVKTLTIPQAISTIDSNSFSESALQNVTMTGRTKGATVSIANFPFGLGDSVVFHCTDGDFHGARYIAAGTTALPANAFKDNADIIMGIMPSTVTSVGNNAYANCAKLEYVEFPASVTTVGTGVFTGSSPNEVGFVGKTMQTVNGITNFPFGVTSLTMPFMCSDGRLYRDGWKWGVANSTKQPIQTLTEVNIGIQVGTVAQGKYKGSTSVFSVTNSSYCLTSIGKEAFANCSMLESVTAGTHDTNNRQDTYVIGESAFSGCTSLTTFTNSLASEIGNSAFSGCNALTSVNFQKCTKVGSGAFSGCSSVTSISLPVATTVSSGAFSGCTSISSVTLPAATTLGEGVFSGSSITSLTIPAAYSIQYNSLSGATQLGTVTAANVSSISSVAFNGCTSLASVSTNAQTLTIGAHAFENCTALNYSRITAGSGAKITLSGPAPFFSIAMSSGGLPVETPLRYENRLMHIKCNPTHPNYSVSYKLDSSCRLGILSTKRTDQTLENLTITDVSVSGVDITRTVFSSISSSGRDHVTAFLRTQCSALGAVTFTNFWKYDASGYTYDTEFTCLLEYPSGTTPINGVYLRSSNVTNLTLTNATTLGECAFFNATIGVLDAKKVVSANASATLGANIGHLITYSFMSEFAATSLSGVHALTTKMYDSTQIQSLPNFPFGMATGSTITDKNGVVITV